MSTMLEEETNNFSLVAALHITLPPIPSKNSLLPPAPVPTPVPTIAASTVGTLAAAFPDLSTKFQ